MSEKPLRAPAKIASSGARRPRTAARGPRRGARRYREPSEEPRRGSGKDLGNSGNAKKAPQSPWRHLLVPLGAMNKDCSETLEKQNGVHPFAREWAWRPFVSLPTPFGFLLSFSVAMETTRKTAVQRTKKQHRYAGNPSPGKQHTAKWRPSLQPASGPEPYVRPCAPVRNN